MRQILTILPIFLLKYTQTKISSTENVVKSTEEDKIQDENAEEIQKSIEMVRMDTPTIEYTQPSDGDDSDENSQKSLTKEIPVVKAEDVDSVSKNIQKSNAVYMNKSMKITALETFPSIIWMILFSY